MRPYWIIIFSVSTTGMCDILQSQQVGNHSSVNLRLLVDCILRNPLVPAGVKESCDCFLPDTVPVRTVTVPSSTTALLQRVACQPILMINPESAQICLTTADQVQLLGIHQTTGGLLAAPPILLHSYSPTSLINTRTLPMQSKIERICISNRRPPASVVTARARVNSENATPLAAYQRATVVLPAARLPTAPRAGVPFAQNPPCFG